MRSRLSAHVARLMALALVLSLLPLAACGLPLPRVADSAPRTATPIPTQTALQGREVNGRYLMTVHELRVAYGVEKLIQRGYTGKGQTVVVIDSFGSPTLQRDLDQFSRYYGLPPAQLQILAPLGTKPFDPTDNEMLGWAFETTEDVQIIHAIAPDAKIVVLTSPVAETEGTVGLPEFLQLEQYAVERRLGTIISQSWAASEVTLTDAAGKAEMARWNAFYQDATTQKGITFFASSGDQGATDYRDMGATLLSPVATTNFPTDNPWVTSVGGTTLVRGGASFSEVAWDQSGGGYSRFYETPAYQKQLPTSTGLKGRRGVPDVSSTADTRIGLGGFFQGSMFVTNGTSAGAPLWSGLTAIANQMAGRPLGFLNPTLYALADSPQYARDFHDITLGNNDVDRSGVVVDGYDAVPGWDAVTGLGSPNAEFLIPDLVAAATA